MCENSVKGPLRAFKGFLGIKNENFQLCARITIRPSFLSFYVKFDGETDGGGPKS